MELRIKSRKLNREIVFTCGAENERVSKYIWLDLNDGSKRQTQICMGGCFYGSTLAATTKTFEKTCRKWYRSYLKNIEN